MLNPCIYCANFNECETDKEMEDYCENFYPVEDFTEDDYIAAIVEERRAAFRSEWFVYIDCNE